MVPTIKRYRRIMLMIMPLVLLFSCSSSKEVVIKLSSTPGLNREMGATFYTTYPTASDSSTVYYASQLELETYIITQFLHRPWEQLYQDWKSGKTDSASFATALQRYTKESIPNKLRPSLDNQSIFLFGRKKSGEYVVVVDENNNNSFQDDSVRTVAPTKGKTRIDDTASQTSVQIRNLKGYDHEDVLTFSTSFNLQPTIASDAPLPPSDDFYLNLVSSESFTGRFRFKGKTHKVALRNTRYPIFNDKPEFMILKFAEGNEDSAFLKRWNTRAEYRIGDTIALTKQVFLIKEASTQHPSVTLKPLRISSSKITPKQIDPSLEAAAANADKKWKGTPYPSFTIKGQSGILSNETLKEKVVFINFWFAACQPCIAEFEALSELYNRLKSHPNFEFVSFTFESPEVVERVKEKYKLTFPIYSVSEQECQRLNLGNGYPTNVIVDKNGAIKYLYVGGKTSKPEAKAFIDNEIYVRINEAL